MNKTEILTELKDCIERCDTIGLENNVGELLEVTNKEESSHFLSVMLFETYTTFKADSTAKLLEVIIRKQPELAMQNFPANAFFKLAVIRGSMDLYECYIEEAIEPFLHNKTEDKIIDCYGELYSIADDFTEEFFPKYVRCVKGVDFNGAIAPYEKNEDILLINKENYEVMNDVVEKYNTILGRRDILNDLNKRMDI